MKLFGDKESIMFNIMKIVVDKFDFEKIDLYFSSESQKAFDNGDPEISDLIALGRLKYRRIYERYDQDELIKANKIRKEFNQTLKERKRKDAAAICKLKVFFQWFIDNTTVFPYDNSDIDSIELNDEDRFFYSHSLSYLVLDKSFESKSIIDFYKKCQFEKLKEKIYELDPQVSLKEFHATGMNRYGNYSNNYVKYGYFNEYVDRVSELEEIENLLMELREPQPKMPDDDGKKITELSLFENEVSKLFSLITEEVGIKLDCE